MAIVSSKQNISLGRTIFLGEVSLTGVVKNVFLCEKRLNEAAKLGFTDAMIPENYDGKIPENMNTIRVKNISDVMKKISKK